MKKSKKNELRYNEDDERTLLEDILRIHKSICSKCNRNFIVCELCCSPSSCRWQEVCIQH